MPGSPALSIATTGCPLHCKFCQNWERSQAKPEDIFVKFVPPQKIVNQSALRDVPIIAFTYNEPTVFTEYLLDIAKIAKGKKALNWDINIHNPNQFKEIYKAWKKTK